MNDYPYFWSMLVFFTLICLAIAGVPQQRKSLLLSACLGAPFSLLALFVVPEYWNPRKIIDLPVGIEDVLFSFSTGGLAWFFFCICRPGLFKPSAGTRLRASRYLFWIVLGGFMFEGLRWMGWNNSESIWISIYLEGFLFFFLRRYLGLPALAAGFAFAGAYALILKVFLMLWPETLVFWSAAIAGDSLGGMPLMELIWALGYGFTWPLFMAHVFDLQPTRETPPDPTRRVAMTPAGPPISRAGMWRRVAK